MMFHLNTDVEDFVLWAEQSYVVLPGGDDVLLAQGDGRHAKREQPAVAILRYTCESRTGGGTFAMTAASSECVLRISFWAG
jgi:hypothetical protein